MQTIQCNVTDYGASNELPEPCRLFDFQNINFLRRCSIGRLLVEELVRDGVGRIAELGTVAVCGREDVSDSVLRLPNDPLMSCDRLWML